MEVARCSDGPRRALAALAVALAVVVVGAGCGSSPGAASVTTKPVTTKPVTSPPGYGTAVPGTPAPQPSPAAGGAQPGTVTGRFLERAEPRGPLRPVEGVTVGLYAEPFLPGSGAMDATAGPAVVTGTTGPTGAYVLSDVPAGTWFVAAAGRPGTPGRAVLVTAQEGAAVDLEGCGGCPPPA